MIYTHTTAQFLKTLTITLTLTNTDSVSYIYAKRAHPLLGSTPYYIYKGKIAAGRYKINPRRRFCCITAAHGFKVAKFEHADSNVRNRPFETGRTTGQRSRSIDVIYARPRADRPEITLQQHKIRCKDNYFFVTSKLF